MNSDQMKTMTTNSTTIVPQKSASKELDPCDCLWTMRDVARYIKCSVRTVCNLQKAGLPFMKIGHLTRYESKAVMRWMGNDQASCSGRF